VHPNIVTSSDCVTRDWGAVSCKLPDGPRGCTSSEHQVQRAACCADACMLPLSLKVCGPGGSDQCTGALTACPHRRRAGRADATVQGSIGEEQAQVRGQAAGTGHRVVANSRCCHTPAAADSIERVVRALQQRPSSRSASRAMHTVTGWGEGQAPGTG
jgi:hypothetical protein